MEWLMVPFRGRLLPLATGTYPLEKTGGDGGGEGVYAGGVGGGPVHGWECKIRDENMAAGRGWWVPAGKRGSYQLARL